MAAFLGLFLAIMASLKLLPVQHVPQRFQVPLFPFTPALGILFTIYLVCSLGWPAYVRFGAWMVAGLAVYALYGVHGAEQREMEHNRQASTVMHPLGWAGSVPAGRCSSSTLPGCA